MTDLLQRIVAHARRAPQALALTDGVAELSYAALAVAVTEWTARLRQLQVRCLALALDNGLAWALADLAALAAGVVTVPVPPFFSEAQVRHLLRDAGVQAVLTDAPQRLRDRADGWRDTDEAFAFPGAALALLWRVAEPVALPSGVAKITYTSGTTGEPRGVMLTKPSLWAVTASLARAVSVRQHDRCLALSPLAVLLENIGALYVPLWAGAAAVLPPLAQTGVVGASGLDARCLHDALARHRASAAILSPRLLQGLVEVMECGGTALPALRFLALGGAVTPARLLARAQALGLPVYEGYGLSECASVVTLNTPDAARPGSVGRPLPHSQLRVDADGEIWLRGNLCAGYLGAPWVLAEDGWWRSGDLGRLDADGYLYLTGRRRQVFITAFGRNVAPEWVEGELCLEPAIAQAAVFGEARPWNAALILPAQGASHADVEAALVRVNALLPDYARVSRWLAAEAPMTPANGLLTGTGRLRRHAIAARYGARLDALYQKATLT